MMRIHPTGGSPQGCSDSSIARLTLDFITCPRETVYIIIFTRGREELASTVPSHSQRSKFMTAIKTLISTMPENVRLLLVNGGGRRGVIFQFSRSCSGVIPSLSKKRDVLAESTSFADEASRQWCCPFFGHA